MITLTLYLAVAAFYMDIGWLNTVDLYTIPPHHRAAYVLLTGLALWVDFKEFAVTYITGSKDNAKTN